MNFWRRKKAKRWRGYYRVEWYSTGELQQFLQSELDAISYRSQPVWEHIERAAKLELRSPDEQPQPKIEIYESIQKRSSAAPAKSPRQRR